MLQHTGHSVAGTQPLIEVIEIPGRFTVFSPHLSEQREMPELQNLVAAIGLTARAGEKPTEAPVFDHEITELAKRRLYFQISIWMAFFVTVSSLPFT